MSNLEHIKHLRAQDYGVAGLSTTDVDWLIAEVERLTAERDCLQDTLAAYDRPPATFEGERVMAIHDEDERDFIDMDGADLSVTPLYKTSPERIGLAIGDEMEDWLYEFHDCDEVTWYSGEPPVQVSIGYVRADLYDALRARVAELKIEVEAKRQDHEAACCIIADMHRAAVGQITGPRRGVVEDVEDIHHMAERAAIMAFCGYFSRMRGPDAWLDHGSWDEYPELFACAGVDLRSFQHGTRFYAGSAPVPAVPAIPDIGSEWKPCVKLPVVVHVREQRVGETHVSTREGITPVKPDDLIMRGVKGEEYPIGRELFAETYRMSNEQSTPVPAEAKVEDALVQDAWTFVYEPETNFVGAYHTRGGKQSICEIRNPTYRYELGARIAELLNTYGIGNGAMLAAKAKGE